MKFSDTKIFTKPLSPQKVHIQNKTQDNCEYSTRMAITDASARDNSLQIPRNNKDYLFKLCHLWKRKDKNYSIKRERLFETQFQCDENNNLYLTLPKFNYIEKKKKLTLEPKDIRLQMRKLTKNRTVLKEPENSRPEIEKLIPEFYLNGIQMMEEEALLYGKNIKDNSDSDSQITEMNEEQQNQLNAKLRTKNQFHEKISKKKIEQTRTGITVVEEIGKMRKKVKLLKRMKLKEKDNKKKLHTVDFFGYDSKKWKKKNATVSEEIESAINEIEGRRSTVITKISSSIGNQKTIIKDMKAKTSRLIHSKTSNWKRTLPYIQPRMSVSKVHLPSISYK